MDARSLQVAMGHSRLDTTQRYLADAEQYIGAVKRHVNTGDGARAIVEHRRSLAAAAAEVSEQGEATGETSRDR